MDKSAPPVLHEDLSGKTVMVTGANTGIGFEAAQHFATMNPARLIIVCRSMAKAQESIKKIEEETRYKNAEPMVLELESFESVSKFASQASQTLDRLDVLVENAGTMIEYTPTKDGWDTTLQVNALAPALHSLLLLPLITKTQKEYGVCPRIVVVSSTLISSVTISSEAVSAPNTLKVLSTEEYFGTNLQDRYSVTKVLNNMLVHKLAAHLPKSIIPVACCPGLCITDLGRHVTGELAEEYKQLKDQYAITSEQGSRQLIFAALGGKDNGQELRGNFTSYGQVEKESDWLSDEGKKAEDKIWNEMIELFSKIDDRIPSIVAEYINA